MTIIILKGRQVLKIFPDVSSEKILFKEKRASGFSRKSFITRLGGANRVLEVIITSEELWIRSPLLFAGVGDHSDLIHNIPLNNILKIERINNKVIISFKTAGNLVATLELNLKKAIEFVEIISARSRGRL